MFNLHTPISILSSHQTIRVFTSRYFVKMELAWFHFPQLWHSLSLKRLRWMPIMKWVTHKPYDPNCKLGQRGQGGDFFGAVLSLPTLHFYACPESHFDEILSGTTWVVSILVSSFSPNSDVFGRCRCDISPRHCGDKPTQNNQRTQKEAHEVIR